MRAAEREMTVAWGWVLVGTALSQVIGAPIAAGRDCHCLHNPSLQEMGFVAVFCLCSCLERQEAQMCMSDARLPEERLGTGCSGVQVCWRWMELGICMAGSGCS